MQLSPRSSAVVSPTVRRALPLALAVTALTAPRGAPAQHGPTAISITHVTVIDVASGTRLLDRTVTIRGTRIASVSAAASAPAGAQVIDGRGKFLIPGLWDMHAHAVDDKDGNLRLFVAYGVTGIRDMGGSLDVAMAGVARIRRGEIVSPRVVAAGTIIDGAPTTFPEVSVTARTPAEGRHWVDSLAARGVDFIKAYEMLRPEVAEAIVDEARLHHLSVAGHVPLTMDAGKVSDLGYHSMEHLRNIDVACSSVADSVQAAAVDQLRAAEGGTRRGSAVRQSIQDAQRMRVLDTFDAARCDALLHRLQRNGTWQVPTFAVADAFLLRTDTTAALRSVLPLLSPATRADWENASRGMDAAQAQIARFLGGTAAFTALVSRARARDHDTFRRMLALGVPVLAGTDFGNPWVAPGFSLHYELATFVRDGMTPFEALRSATLSPARFLGATDSLGTVAAGKLADLVLLDADPLLDIGNSKRIRAVVANGRLFDRAGLDALLVPPGSAGTNLSR
jgi:imidazolonepropionase-like amidohydrolase